MQLQNLSSLFQDLKIEMEGIVFRDSVLPADFKSEYERLFAEAPANLYKKIHWVNYSVHITTKDDQFICAPNHWFYLAYKTAPFVTELRKHQEVFNQVFAAYNSGDRRKEIASELRDKIKNFKVYVNLINLYFSNNNISDSERDNFIVFVSDYETWGGGLQGKGKTIDRADFYISAVMLSGKLVVAAQGFIATIAGQLSENPKLLNALAGAYETTPDPSENPAVIEPEPLQVESLRIPKPFILLAGISGTGKTRFVRAQAGPQGQNQSNYCLIPVRPDWHEPSDLLGYVSRIGGETFVITELLKFLVTAWKMSIQTATLEKLAIKPLAEIKTFWLCLDEMNLAPVEQYFADFLSVLETRNWEGLNYECEPILKSSTFNLLDKTALTKLRKDLDLNEDRMDGLWDYFCTVGIPIPPNLIVAGTVNMDETTHTFSRKVIDRAFTVDFGNFFPNEFNEYFSAGTRPKKLGFSLLSQVQQSDLGMVPADYDGTQSIGFMQDLNAILKDTSFELAFRALNELLIALVCFKPKDIVELQAVWDDFLMTKVLPRIDGDVPKLNVKTKANGNEPTGLLESLILFSEQKFDKIWHGIRPDLLRESIDSSMIQIECRSKKKLVWMKNRLDDNGFTSFWP